MSTWTARRAAISLTRDPAERRHRFALTVSAYLLVAFTIVLAVFGFDYYTLDQTHRVFSPKHLWLKPSGAVGIRLGILGVLFFLLIYLYAVRKRWPWLAKRGNSKHWLNFHVLLGLAAPVMITFHSSFKFQGIAGVAYWVMMAVALSGFVGRYIYAQFPKSLGSAEMSLRELEAQSAQLTEQLHAQEVFSPEDIAPLSQLPDARVVQNMPAVSVLLFMLRKDLTLPVLIWRLRRRALRRRFAYVTLGGLLPARNRELERAITTVRRQATLSKKIFFLSKTEELFRLWHVVHRPFSYSFSILACIHIFIVLLFGYH